MNLRDPNLRRWAVRVLKVAVLVLVVWGIHSTLWTAWQDLENEHWNVSQLRPGWLVAAAGCYLLGQLGPGFFWWRILRWLGQPARPLETLRAYYIGHVGKYAPGKAMVIVLRAGLLRAGGTTATGATVAVFFETLTTMGVGAAMAVCILAARFREDWTVIGIAVLLWAVVSGPTNPSVFRRLVRFTGAGKLDPAMAERLVHLRYRSLAACWLEIAAGWLLMGLSLWATARAAGFHSQLGLFDEIGFCTAAVAMSVVGGFLSFLPGGLGVREAALLTLLSPIYGRDGALVASIVSRLVWVVAELTFATILYASLGRPRRLPDGTAPL
ncbi:MAG TPA: lysylphosphatidylglycerol synthase transmembrane domain-containing protein [Pirellulales bacterium]|nr:lysylphosphatidylglycerol synthase transmembrane domain-containing protein [Pirellulales bacterium]